MKCPTHTNGAWAQIMQINLVFAHAAHHPEENMYKHIEIKQIAGVAQMYAPPRI